MATRFYFHGGAYTPSITPAYSSEWDKTTNVVRRLMSPRKLSSINTTSSDSEDVSTSPYDILNRQLISKPLAAQIISGTVKGQIRCAESNAGADMCAALVIKVVSGDGNTVRGVLLSYFPSSLTSEYETTLTNRYFPPETSLNTVEAQEGDVLVIEIGTRAFNTVTTTYTSQWHINDSADADDLPVDESTTTNLASWIEFSQDIQFSGQVVVYQSLAQVEYLEPPQIIVAQTVVQVEYAEKTGFDYNGSAAINNSVSSAIIQDKVYNGTASIVNAVTSEHYYTVTRIYEGAVNISHSVSSNVARDIFYSGNIGITVSPSSVVVFDRLYSGNAQIKNQPSSIVARDIYYSGSAQIKNTVSGQSDSGIREHTTTGGVQCGGGYDYWADFYNQFSLSGVAYVSGEFGFDIPEQVAPSDTFDLVCPVVIGRAFVVSHVSPAIDEYSFLGDFVLGGGLKASSYTPLTAPSPTTIEIVLSGGVAVWGLSSPVSDAVDFPTEEIDLISNKVLSGGVRVGGIRFPLVEVYTPETIEATTIEIASRARVIAAGSLDVEYQADSFGLIYDLYWHTGGVLLGGACVFSVFIPPVSEVEVSGQILIEGDWCEGDELMGETWAFHGYMFSPSLYSNHLFNSYVERGNDVLAAKHDGIYILTGEDDNGEKIYSGVRIGPTNFGLRFLKRIRAVYVGDCGLGAQLRAASDEGECWSDLQGQRFDVDTVVQGDDVVIDIQDFDILSHLEILPFVRRSR